MAQTGAQPCTSQGAALGDGLVHTTAETRYWAETKFEKKNKTRKTETNVEGSQDCGDHRSLAQQEHKRPRQARPLS